MTCPSCSAEMTTLTLDGQLGQLKASASDFVAKVAA